MTLLKRFGVLSFGAIALLLVMSYHPDAAQDQVKTLLANKQEALVSEAQQSLVFAGSEKYAPTGDVYEHLNSLPSGQELSFLKSLWERMPWKQNKTHGKAAIALDSLITNPSMTSVPMASKPKALFVKVKVNDSVSGHFILDTGATYTTISRKMARDLGLNLENSKTISITTANGELQVPKVSLRTVNVNNIQAKDVEATVMDFEENSTFSGLLGLSFIQHFKLTLDPQNGQMVFEPIK